MMKGKPMKPLTRWRGVGLVWLLLCGTLSGCGKKASAQRELTMWLVGSEAQAQTINALGKAFT